MKYPHNVAFCLFAAFSLLFNSQQALAEKQITVASGAGYKKMVQELCSSYSNTTQQQVLQSYANMGQITAQAQASDKIDCIIGDKTFLDAAPLPYGQETVLGHGKLFAAIAPGVPLDNLQDLTNPQITRIAYPDARKAIYGKAAHQFLTHGNLFEPLQPKLIMVGTVPQVSAYLLSGEVDIGFINGTEAQRLKQRGLRVIAVPEETYSPIIIVARQIKRQQQSRSTQQWLSFLHTPEAQQIANQYGLYQ